MPDILQEQEGFEPITSQEDLDKIVKGRIARERAKFEGYEEYKAKAAKYDELEAATKTELQKAIDRAEAAEAKVAEYDRARERAVWNSEISEATGLPLSLVSDLEAGSKEALLEKAERHAKALKGATVPQVPRDTNHAGTPKANSREEFVNTLFKGKER